MAVCTAIQEPRSKDTRAASMLVARFIFGMWDVGGGMWEEPDLKEDLR